MPPKSSCCKCSWMWTLIVINQSTRISHALQIPKILGSSLSLSRIPSYKCTSKTTILYEFSDFWLHSNVIGSLISGWSCTRYELSPTLRISHFQKERNTWRLSVQAFTTFIAIKTRIQCSALLESEKLNLPQFSFSVFLHFEQKYITNSTKRRFL